MLELENSRPDHHLTVKNCTVINLNLPRMKYFKSSSLPFCVRIQSEETTAIVIQASDLWYCPEKSHLTLEVST